MARVKKVHHTPAASIGLLRRVESYGMRKGRHNKNWLYVGTGLWTLRTIRRMAERREEILISEPLRPGDRLIIANNRPTLEGATRTRSGRSVKAQQEPKGRRARKRKRKADAAAAKEQAKRDEKAAKADAKMQAKIARKQAKRPKKAEPAETVVAD